MTKELEELWDKIKSQVSVQEQGKIDFFLAIKDKYDEIDMWEALPENEKGKEEKTLQDFDSSDIADELSMRIEGGYSNYRLGDIYEQLKDDYKNDDADLPTGLAEDEWKKEHLASVWSQYTLKELEERLPDKRLVLFG